MASLPAVNLDAYLNGDRALTVRRADGRALVSVGLGPGAAAAVAALIVAPRATALAALAGMFRGLSITVDAAAPTSVEPEAA